MLQKTCRVPLTRPRIRPIRPMIGGVVSVTDTSHRGIVSARTAARA